jgi:uncharacterized OB-fold protein
MPYLDFTLVPLPDVDTKPFWDACKRHELVIQQCTECGWYRHFPRPTCPKCRSRNFEWVKMSGKGNVWGYTIVTRPIITGMTIPYNLVHVELEEQADILLSGNLIDCKPDDIQIGMPVEVTFEDINPDFTMYYWKKAA